MMFDVAFDPFGTLEHSRESPRNLKCKTLPRRSTASDPESLRDVQHRNQHGFAPTEVVFTPLRVPYSYLARFSTEPLLAKCLCSTLLLFRCLVPSRVGARASPILRAQKTREPQRRSRGPLTNTAGRPESAVPEIGSSLTRRVRLSRARPSEHLCVRDRGPFRTASFTIPRRRSACQTRSASPPAVA
jgi:hypothetical protein